MTPREYATKHGIHLALVYLHLRVGQVPGAVRNGGRWVIPAGTPDSRKFRIGGADGR